MIKKYSLVFIALLCSFFYGFGQIAKQSFEASGDTWTPLTFSTPPCTNGDDVWNYQTNLNGITPNEGAQFWGIQDLNGNCGGAGFETISLPNVDVSAYTSNIFSFDFNAFEFDASDDIKYELFYDNISQGEVLVVDGNGNLSTTGWETEIVNIPGTVTNVRVIISVRQNGAGDYGGIDNIILNGTPSCTDTLDFYNLQSPEFGSITVGSPFNVFAKTYEPGITNDGDAPDDAGDGIEVWIGYNTIDNNPSSSGWTWIPATFNTQIVNDDEFVAEIGSTLPSGTYYYASRFRLNGCSFTYGGYDVGGGNGVWDGINDVNGVLTVNQVDFCNLQFPETGNIVSGGIFDVYARVYEPGITDASNVAAGTGIEAWIGYSAIDATTGNSINNSTTRTDFESSNWTWIPAGYNQDYGNDDEFFVDIGSCLPPGNYFYASRFRLNGGEFSYGGIEPPNGGNFWDGSTYVSGVLTVTDPPLADVVITEIMYNSTGADDEWIEICNISGSSQDISNYIIDVGGSTEFTFPCNTVLLNGECITIDLGDGGGADYNPDCPFTADYSSNSSSGTLNNTSDTITLYSSNGSSVVDVVTYDNSDGGFPPYSLHVIDATQDNSDTGSNWQEVDLGGSPNFNSLTPRCLPLVAEIRVEGNLGTFPNIPDDDTGSNAPTGTNNTLFAAQFVGSTQSKSYRIHNLGANNLNLNSVSLIGADPGEFNISISPASPVVYGTPSILEITFAPTTAGVKNAIVQIVNNDDNTDGDTEETYTFNIQGEGKCVGVIDSISPASGPEGTIVTVSATGIDLSNIVTASFNGVSVIVLNYIAATDELEVTVPTGALDGNLELLDGFGCTGVFPFDIIDTKISNCDSAGSLLELIISEITDATTGGLTYIEIYNGTGAPVNLNDYSIEIFSNGSTTSNSVALNNVMLANDDTYVLAIGVASSPDTVDPGANTCPITGGNGQLADQTSTVGGINKKDNEHDVIRLVNSGGVVDEFGVYQDDDWMDTTIVTGNRGFNFRRLNTVAAAQPKAVFNINDWNVIDWVGSGLSSCSTNIYTDIGGFDFSTGSPPNISDQPELTATSCDTTASSSVTASEGVANGKTLVYQWYVSTPGSSGWTELSDSATYSGTSSNTLNILNTIGLDNYQYYCQVREDDETCYTASNATRLHVQSTVWYDNSGTLEWSNGVPNISTLAAINANYSTLANGSFEACTLIINAGNTLTIDNNDYVEVENNIGVFGSVIVQTQGALVQNDNSGTFALSGTGTSQVNKLTSPLTTVYNYTYWSSPVEDALIGTALFTANPNRLFYYNASQYLDTNADDIDDSNDDWQIANLANIMEPGRGYAATHTNIGFIPGTQYQYIFPGAFNTGIITHSLAFNGANITNHWNLVGNPYPSAIAVNTPSTGLLAVNSGIIKPEVFMWSQYRPPLGINPGNQNLNFSQDDYLTINNTGPVGNGSDLDGSGSIDANDVPGAYIPSGQAFFVSSLSASNLTFNNAMRISGDDSNDQFFEPNSDGAKDSNDVDTNPERLWLNLISDNGAANQLLVGYLNQATDGFDLGYDTKRNLSANSSTVIYTMIDEMPNEKFVIQGKHLSNLNTDEIIPVGFKTSIDVPTIFTFSFIKYEGSFLENSKVYIKDNFLNLIHNLKESDYNFTSEIGEFNDRFEIVFNPDGTLGTDDVLANNNTLQIIEHNDGCIQFKLSSSFKMKSIKILDILGRTLYDLEASGDNEIYQLDNLSQSSYVAQVELTNGYIINKKALKRK